MSIRKGTALLDAKYPEWYKAIDLEDLDLSSEDRCIIGQLVEGQVIPRPWDTDLDATNYYQGVTFLEIEDKDTEYGFNARVPYDGLGYLSRMTKEYERLTGAWKRAIERRLRKDRT